MEKIVILIPTYDRPDMLKKLLADIKREMPLASVYVFNDGSHMDYSKVVKNVNYRKMMEHCGKQKFWKLVTYMFHQLKCEHFDYMFFLPDDVRLKAGFYETCLKAYKELEAFDKRMICLSVGHANNRAYTSCWTRYQPRPMNTETPILKTQWNDMCFMATRAFFDALRWEIPPISKTRWETNPKKSSGVGRHISLTLHPKYSMYHLEKTQVIFSNANKSMMQKHV